MHFKFAKLNTTLMKLLSMLTLVLLIMSCEKEPEFTCNSNTVYVANNEKQCGTSKIMSHSQTGTSSEEFRMQIAGGYEIRLMNLTGLFIEGQTYAPYDFYFSNINQQFSNQVTFVKIDRTNKVVTLKFVFDNEAESNFRAFKLKAEGEATNLTYQ
jgi:hypothetical protein